MLGARFDHQQELPNQAPNLPAQLDPKLFSREALLRRGLDQNQGLQPFRDSALEWLVSTEMDPAHRRELLRRITRPDYPGIVAIVVQDLQAEGSQGFGSLQIHSQLLLDQLDELGQKLPDVVPTEAYVRAYIPKLRPRPEINLEHDATEREAYLKRLADFVLPLDPVQNSLKAHVLYHQMAHDLTQGRWDRARFLSYLKLPRQVPYVRPEWLRQIIVGNPLAELQATGPTEATGLPPVGSDEDLVRKYLDHLLADASDSREFAPYIEKEYLQRVFAESKLTRGIGDASRWYALMNPSEVEQLRTRIDLEFAPTNPKMLSRDEIVKLDLDLKNVPSLIVKIYEINTLNQYRRVKRAVGPDIELDGLVPNVEHTFKYEEAPLLRVRRSFSFPELTRPGVYVVDFIGNGRSSRAIVRKGDLQVFSTINHLGHQLSVFDEQQNPVNDAVVWLDGHRFSADKDGHLLIPFTAKPGPVDLVVQQGSLAVLRPFHHAGEIFELQASMYIDRESLLPGVDAPVMIRPNLLLNGIPIPVTRLENTKLLVQTVDQDGIATTEEVSPITIQENAETVVVFRVPRQLATLTLTLAGKVQRMTDVDPQDLMVSQTYQVNDIDATDQLATVYLQRSTDSYELSLRGKSGEVLPQRPVHLELNHRDFVEPIRVTLKSDDHGIVLLGLLAGIDSIKVTMAHSTERQWQLLQDDRQYPSVINAPLGVELRVPIVVAAKNINGKNAAINSTTSDVSLLETVGTSFVRNMSHHIQADGRELVISGLPVGEYDLFLKATDDRIRVHVLDGTHDHATVRNSRHVVEVSPRSAALISGVDPTADKLVIRVANASASSRVHIFATHFEPAWNAFEGLAHSPSSPVISRRQWEGNQFAVGRKIGDEYQYILDRKFATRFPGIMLRRPELLLHPWELTESVSQPQSAEEGSAFAGEARKLNENAPSANSLGRTATRSSDSSNLNFLPHSSFLAANLRLNADGVVELPIAQLAASRQLTVLLVDGDVTEARHVALSKQEWQPRDRRLKQGFPQDQHLIRTQRSTYLTAGQSLQLESVASGRYRIYDTLDSAFRLLSTLQPDSRLAEFAFLGKWGSLSTDAKREKYDAFACHELNLFLFRKDREFFDSIVRPHLQNKLQKTFLDDWLLERDLSPYLESWRYGQLNILERILLGQRVAGERAAMQQFVRDQFQLQPRVPQLWDRLFQTALVGQSLAAANVSGPLPSHYFVEALDNGVVSGGKAVDLERSSVSTDGRLGSVDSNGDMSGRVVRGRQRFRQQREAESLAELSKEQQMPTLAFPEGLRRFYRQLDSTKQWAETHYDQVRWGETAASFLALNSVWHDFANAPIDQPFVPANWLYAHGSRNEALLMLAVLDLPFEAKKHELETTAAGVTIRAASPALVYHETFECAEESAADSPVLVNQRYFDPSIRSEVIAGQPRDKYLDTDDFVVQHVYGCQVNVSNSASTVQTIRVLLQVPAGSMPVQGGVETRVVTLQLAPFSSQKLEYFFYFPQAGTFGHYPVQVYDDARLLAFFSPTTLTVAEKSPAEDPTSWNYVSQFGTESQVLEFLAKENVHGLQLDRIAFRMRDRDFFGKTLEELRRRHVYEPALWSYGIYHRDSVSARELISQTSTFVQQCGGYLQCELLVIDEKERRQYEHLEFRPLVNARAHRLGARRQIADPQVHGQFLRFLKTLSYKPNLASQDWLEVTYYLLLQDRLKEALATFQRVQPNEIPEQMQYDYTRAYLDCLQDDPQIAREITKKYVDYPVLAWRKAFAAIRGVLNELEGHAVELVDKTDPTQVQTKMADQVPTIDVRYENEQVRVDYAHVDQLQVNYYLMDLEVLFSRNPFLKSFSGEFATIRPNDSREVKLDGKGRFVQLSLPEGLQRRNVLVEIEAGEQVRSLPIYSHDMSIQLLENHGQIQVQHAATAKPLSKVYVKVYAENQDGSVSFYKDGYTDVRGRFDYAAVSTNQLDNVKRFALLLMSDEHGATVREAQRPKQ
ncbi:MAG: hypothetical protein O2931_01390 [Planctomycetota bacterium]|nr:hypothetical protein [Planctomycetota bacterium]MDA1177427.1 hypothetical protein [Planctomycetota bacterium]